ncbi:MAG: 2',5' RNA ligase family [Elusimicrobia bacterium ADurb.Bin231]|nr:MAG: 2',5' RNA ligase family [Elusimicrobia bacterium ADurb.Bin231]
MRIFFAVKPSLDGISAIEKIIARLSKTRADIRWVRKENIHITIKFLGETEEDILRLIKEDLKEKISSRKKFLFNLSGIGFFPDAFAPRVIWMGVSAGSEEFSGLARLIDERLCSLINPEMEIQKFVPHLTLGRFKSRKGKDELMPLIHNLNIKIPVSQCEKVLLMKSVLTPRGPEYEEIANFELG